MVSRAEEIWERPLSRRQLLASMAVGGASMAILGCGDDDDETEPGATSSEPKRGGEITLHSDSATVVADPHKSAGVGNEWNLVATSSLRANWQKGTMEPALVEKWESPDPLTMVLSVKKGVHFQQESPAKGREVEAADIVAGLERARTPGDATFTAAGLFVRVDTYEAVDKYTVRVKFKRPDANFQSLLGNFGCGIVLPRETIEKYGANLAVPEAWYGTGPFVPDLSKYQPGISMAFKRNPNYDLTPGLPYLDTISRLTILDISAATAALRTGQTDIALVPTLDVPEFRRRGYQLGTSEELITAQHLAMNVEIAPTNDVRVRQALHRAIDREELRQVVGDGYGCIVMIMGCKPSWFLSEKEWEGKPGFRKDHKQDIAEAKQLLSAAGVDPTKTTLKLGVGSQSLCICKVHYDQGTAIRGMLERDLGFKIDLVAPLAAAHQTTKFVQENGMHITNVAQGSGQGLIPDVALFYNLASFGANNCSLWKDKKTDDLYEQQVQALNTDRRKQIIQEAQRYLMQEDVLPVAPTVRNFDWFGVNAKIRGWQTPAYYRSQFTWQFDKVWLDS